MTTSRTHIIVDLNSLVHQTYHSFAPGHWSSPQSVTMFEEDEADLNRDEAVYIDITEKLWFRVVRYFKLFSADHAVLASDSGTSWRYKVYPEYKATRKLSRSEQKVKDMDLIHMIIDDFCQFSLEHTKMTVVEGLENTEADDIIARWCALHDVPGWHTVIISGDGDFKQLVSPNVSLFSPVTNKLYYDFRVFKYAHEPSVSSIPLFGSYWELITDDNGEPLEFDPGYDLFVKLIRGDNSDNIPAAYPRVRSKRLKEAYYGSDVEFNKLIHESYMVGDSAVPVIDGFIRNQTLIDLRMIPDHVAGSIDERIIEMVNRRTDKYPSIALSRYASRNGLENVRSNLAKFSILVESGYR